MRKSRTRPSDTRSHVSFHGAQDGNIDCRHLVDSRSWVWFRGSHAPSCGHVPFHYIYAGLGKMYLNIFCRYPPNCSFVTDAKYRRQLHFRYRCSILYILCYDKTTGMTFETGWKTGYLNEHGLYPIKVIIHVVLVRCNNYENYVDTAPMNASNLRLRKYAPLSISSP